ncbi:hypothetical protein B0H13DRAFT_2011908 [Mycena leptocephala]|nr:hypothetical protein B0H13DRAFT_2011908 [Mycena leptocephala]
MVGCFTWCPLNSKSKRVEPVQYMRGGVKELLSIAETIAAGVPVPLLSEFMKVAIGVLEAYLQKRVYSLSVIIIDKLKVGDSVDEDLQHRIKDLQSILNSISEDLNEIKDQRKWLLIFFRTLNKDKVEKCVVRINAAMEQFNVSHQIRVEELVNGILSKYNSLADGLAEIQKTISNASRPHSAPETLPRQDMPPPHRIFYGRQPFVDDIVHLLDDPQHRGVALGVIASLREKQTFHSEHLFWVPCVEAQSADMLRRILCTQLRVTTDSYDSLDPLIAELNASTERRLLLLDNFETPCPTALPHVSLLVTMTTVFPPSADVEWRNKELSPLDTAAASETFKKLYPDATDEKLDELLEAVGHIPLAIYLMAVEGQHSNASPGELLEQWGKTGTEMISKGLLKNMDRTISMSMNREIMKKNPKAFVLLAIVSMLPAGTTGDNLRWWAPQASLPTDIGTLRAWKLCDSKIFVRPTIQAYMFGQNRIPAEVQQQVHDACYKFRDLEALAKEETNIQGLLMQITTQDLSPHTVDALIAFSLYQLRTKPSTVVAQHALEVALAAKDDFRIAEAHESRRRFKDLPGGADRHRAGECRSLHHEADKLHVARGLLGLGHSFVFMEESAEDTLSAAKAIFEELNSLSLTKEALAKAEQTGDPDIICRLLQSWRSLEILGYNCAAKTDLPAARDAYEGARVHFVKIASRMGKDSEARCSYNLRKLEE